MFPPTCLYFLRRIVHPKLRFPLYTTHQYADKGSGVMIHRTILELHRGKEFYPLHVQRKLKNILYI